jgi:Fe(3+) dicitrate transport protein
MRNLTLAIYLLFATFLNAQEQTLRLRFLDRSQLGIEGVQVENRRSGVLVASDKTGLSVLQATIGDSIRYGVSGEWKETFVIDPRYFQQEIAIIMDEKLRELQEITIVKDRYQPFDVGVIPTIKGTQITTGTNSVIELSRLSGSKSTGNPRELFAKIPGLNIWESDAYGIQLGVGGRGLSPDRTTNFNTRQNGCDISADALGYPESYYTPPLEALKSIEIIRGSAALQYGTQFGGLMNFNTKDPDSDTKFSFTSRVTGGFYGYLGAFHRASGTIGRFSYQVYHQYKRAKGFRENSGLEQHQVFGQFQYRINENQTIRLEYTFMDYLAQQAGGLSDMQFEEDIRQSTRTRNWFAVRWNLLALHYDIELRKGGVLNWRSFGMLSNRKSLGFLGKVNAADPGGLRTLILGDFKNAGTELRYLKRFVLPIGRNGIRSAFLIGGRLYRGQTQAIQGNAPDGDLAQFELINPTEPENSSYDFPSLNTALFTENLFYLGKYWRLNIGFRLEHIESAAKGYFGYYVVHPVNLDTLGYYTQTSDRSSSRTIPLFGAGIHRKVGSNASFYANWTQNYRAINFSDIRITNPNFVVDSLIRDEYGFTSELGFRGLKKNFFIYDAAAFVLFYGDRIGLAPVSGSVLKKRTNIGDALHVGIELYSEFDVLKALNNESTYGFSLFVNGSYTFARYIRSDEPAFLNKYVENVSPVLLRSGIKFKTEKWSIQVQGSYTSRQFSDATNAEVPSGDAVIGIIPSYFIADMSVRWDVMPVFRIEGGVNNLTNAHYFTRRAVSYPGPGIIPSDGIFGYLTLQYVFSVKK